MLIHEGGALMEISGFGDGSKPISINFNGMNIHLPAVCGSLGTRVMTHSHLTG